MFTMLFLFALLAVGGIEVTRGIGGTSQSINSYGTIAVANGTAGTAVRLFQLVWGNPPPASGYAAACSHFNIVSLGGFDGDPQSAAPAMKAQYPNCKILVYVDLSQISSLSWIMSQWNTICVPNDIDGFFIDNCKAGYAGYIQSTLDTLLQNMKAQAPKMIICANGFGDVNNGLPGADTYNYVDIGMLEEFAYAQNWGRSTQHDVDSLAYWTSHGVNISTFHSGPYYNDARGSSAPADTAANCEFALACYLCGVQNNNGYFSWNEVWSSSQGYYPIMSMDPGTPLGPYTQSGNILTRHFTKCNVTVDLSTMTGSIVTI
jgi:hypothetical protein